MILTRHALGSFALYGLLAASPVSADLGDCGQPVSSGNGPLVSDAFAILRKAVGRVSACDNKPCVCDVNRVGGINTADALAILRLAVGHTVPLDCFCSSDAGCTSLGVTIVNGDFDLGWTGNAHGEHFWQGSAFSVRIKQRCSGTPPSECDRDEDCPTGESCEPTCDCLTDTSCEFGGPRNHKRCWNELEPCETNADCENAPCVSVFGGPVPLSAGGTPICMTSFFESPPTGTLDAGSGAFQFSMALRTTIALGNALDQPCPRCGPPEQNPRIGDMFTCEYSPRHGQPCRVDGVTEAFGGTSFDCPPPVGEGDVNPSSVFITLKDVTTGTSTRTAGLPCTGFPTSANPLVPGSNPKCTDKMASGDPVCTSNADCKRCTGDTAIACANDGDCSGNGTCAEAPDQPITCGFWCHCGFCNQYPNLPCVKPRDCPDGQWCTNGFCNQSRTRPCFGTSDCPDGLSCQVGDGINLGTRGQVRANGCIQDGFVCGSEMEEQCATSLKGTCSEWNSSCATDLECEDADAGVCNVEERPCFESRVTRTGTPSPFGRYCAVENKPCDSNADCVGADDYCAPDSSRPQTVALFCVPETTLSPINGFYGILGPAALQLDNLVQICRCGDGDIGCDEECDDGNRSNGDGCDELCEDEGTP
jgi:hypothetical protein